MSDEGSVQVSNEELKSFLFDLVTFTDEVDANGQPVRRKSYPKDFLRGVHEIKNKIIDTLEAGYGLQEEGKTSWSADEMIWVPVKETKLKGWQAPENSVLVTQRQTAEPIEFTRKAVAAVRFFYSARAEIPDVTDECLDLYEKSFGR